MAHTSLTSEQQTLLLNLARNAIVSRFHPRLEDKPSNQHWLNEERATFVTLRIKGALRGCIGSIHPSRALSEDIWENAQAAAFSDPRFPPLSESELEKAAIELSVLTEVQPLNVSSEEQLVSVLRPDIDGLIIDDGLRKATFLPSVWEQISEPESFIEQLRLKAGMPSGYWSEKLRCSVYQVEKLKE